MDRAEQIQILYEISLSIGTSFNLKEVLKTSLSKYLRKLNCSAGGILSLNRDTGKYYYEQVFSIPRRLSNNEAYRYALEYLTEPMNEIEFFEYRKKLPITGVIGANKFFHIMELPSYGMLILVKTGSALSPYIVNSLLPLNTKLANALQACLQNNKMQKSEEKYRNIFNSIQDTYAEVDATSGEILEISPSIFQISGFTREEMIGRVMIDFYIDPEQRKDLMNLLYENNYVNDFESSLIDKAGKQRIVSLSVSLQRGTNNKPEKIVGTMRDISGRKQAEHIIEESKQRLDLALKGGKLGLWDWDILSGNVYFNDQWAKMLGYELNEIEPDLSSWEKLVHPDDMPAVTESLNLHLQGNTPFYAAEFRMLAKSGEWKWIVDRGQVVERDEAGKALRAVGTHSDITRRKQFELQLHESQANLRAVVENTKSLIWSIDKNYCLLTFNSAFQEAVSPFFGESLKYGIHLLDQGRISAELRSYWKSLYDRALADEAFMLELPVDENGQMYETSYNPIFDDDHHVVGVSCFSSNITERKQIEESLRKAIIEAESANKAKSQFLANMSHEIRTPMNAVLGFSDLLSTMVENKKQKSYLNSIQTAGKNLLTLIDDILDLSKIEAGKFSIQQEPMDPRNLFNDIKHIFQMKLSEKELEFILEIDKKIPSALQLDEVRLRQVLFNLVGNSVKFTDSGYIKLSSKIVSRTKENPRVDLIISVEDSGFGIPENQLELIFEAFTQQENQSSKYGGTGLGLAISKRLVELMNGEISVSSKVGTGTTFQIILHNVEIATTSVQENTIEESIDISEISFQNQLVLIADDDISNRAIIREWFSFADMNVIEAKNGKEAVALAKENKPDIIFMDIRMPELDGYEAAKILKQDPKINNIPIIAFTALVKIDFKDKFQDNYFDAYLPKPIKFNDMFNEVTKFLKYNRKAENAEICNKAGENSTTLSEKEIAGLPILIEKLESELMPMWKKLKGAYEIDKVEEFSREVLRLSEGSEIVNFKKYAKELVESAENLEIENVKKKLFEYPALIKQIKKYREEGNEHK